MAIDQTDLDLYASRIRVHFPPELRDTAFALARNIAHAIGPQVKSLQAGTTLNELAEWLGPSYVIAKDSLDEVKGSWQRKTATAESSYRRSSPREPRQRLSPIWFVTWLESRQETNLDLG